MSTAAGHRAPTGGTTKQTGQSDRLDGPAGRAAHLYATDPQFAAAEPKLAVGEATRQPGMRLAPALRTLVAGYVDRPALGQRASELVRDPAAGRTSVRLLPSFDTISYLDMWVRVNAVASGWRRDVRYPVSPGDFVATIGFASPEYLIIDLVCTHLGLVSVPLQHNAPASRLKPIIDEVTPKVVAVSAKVGADKDIPHIARELLEKYVTDLEHLGLLPVQKISTASPLENHDTAAPASHLGHIHDQPA
ncbi:MAG TPA: AMP-binding protein [Mycobacterium sp.]|nr:AMP-binding protein [Mycobacterium sp.]